jgi:hypothetical protein
LVLQRIERVEQVQEPGKPTTSKKVMSYLLTGIDLSAGQQVQRLGLNSTLEADLNRPLQELFEAVEAARNRQTLDFFKSIIPKPVAK